MRCKIMTTKEMFEKMWNSVSKDSVAMVHIGNCGYVMANSYSFFASFVLLYYNRNLIGSFRIEDIKEVE